MISRFVVELPGQPPSWNKTYRIVHLQAKDGAGQPVFRPDGSPKKYSTMKKSAAVADYQQMAGLVINLARPTGFAPAGLLYVLYELFLTRDIDCDNVMKAIDDTLAQCIGIDDKRFLPVAISKKTGVMTPMVRLTVLDAEHWQVAATAR